MSNTKGPNLELEDLGLWYSRDGLKSILFAVLQESISSNSSIVGYVDELNHRTSKDQAIKRLKRVSKKQLFDIKCIDFIYKITNEVSINKNSVHIEKILLELEKLTSVKFISNNTYKSSIINVDEHQLQLCLQALLFLATKSKRLFVDSRRRSNFLVVSFSGGERKWINDNTIKFIRNYRPVNITKNKYNLSELTAYFVLSSLRELMNIKVSHKSINKQEKIYFRIPLSQQLNVFDSATKEE